MEGVYGRKYERGICRGSGFVQQTHPAGLLEGSRFFAFAKIAPLLKVPDEDVMHKNGDRCMKYKKLLFILLVSLFVSGCIDDTSAESPLPESQFYEIISGAYTESGIYTKKQTKVIRSQSEYNEELLNYTSNVPTTIDFTEGKVLLVDMGQRNTGGYSIGVTSVDVSDNYITANIRLAIPGQYCNVTQALTNPYQFVFVPTQKEILVAESLTIYQCNE